ncbi:YHS domain-containing protein [Polaribacter haliotis]|uniref:YHS domain-containing protein n=1 Tax=Polaribacter haliotis TaxID=1888915 RepID=A0A7L8AD47_9FLAO|nr:YHS domain-containing (seleno)protein [Polaribacter haliotis]QOD59925.1 YHS domain-containing protein [Polaribacter haliotis]
MKNIFALLLLITSTTFFAQEYNLDKGYVAEGYDVVSYFNNNPEEGNKDFMTEYDGVKFKFASKENLEKFKNSPKKYVPQYGGYCAYAIGKNGEKVSINPKYYDIRDGKLYLFYKTIFNNTLKDWKEEGPEKLQKQADTNWIKIMKKEM